MPKFTFNGRIDLVATLLGKTFLLRGEGRLTTDEAVLKMSYVAPSFHGAIEVGTFTEIINELNTLGAKLPGTNAGPDLATLTKQANSLPGIGKITQKLGNLADAKIRITELVMEVKAPASDADLPRGTFTIGLGIDLSALNTSDRTLLGVTLDSVVLTLSLDVGH